MSSEARPGPNQQLLIVVTWLWVAVPFGYGLYQLMHKISDLFSN
jgi:hypothetical protein